MDPASSFLLHVARTRPFWTILDPDHRFASALQVSKTNRVCMMHCTASCSPNLPENVRVEYQFSCKGQWDLPLQEIFQFFILYLLYFVAYLVKVPSYFAVDTRGLNWRRDDAVIWKIINLLFI
jgi:hypothetical protein